MSKRIAALSDKAAPLNDAHYRPRVTPIQGAAPAEVAQWGPRTQLRWFHRFERELKAVPHSEWARFYCDSVEHKGLCCPSCIEDRNEGYDLDADYCCCEALRERDATRCP